MPSFPTLPECDAGTTPDSCPRLFAICAWLSAAVSALPHPLATAWGLSSASRIPNPFKNAAKWPGRYAIFTNTDGYWCATYPPSVPSGKVPWTACLDLLL